MARLDGDLWKYNLAKITLVDVSEDYSTFMDPMPSDLYPVLHEVVLPKYKLMQKLIGGGLLSGYFYDWHEPPEREGEEQWYVGVVNEKML
jgi:hypothetical protein